MKIVHVVPYKLDAYSGVYTAIVGLTSALARAGHEIEAWNLSPWPQARPELVDELAAAGVTTRELPQSSQPLALSSDAARMVETDLRADVVHLHSAFSPQNNLLAKRIVAPIVLSPHGVFAEASLAKSQRRKRIFRRLFELPLLRRIAVVTALTEAEADESRAFGYDGRIEVIPNGVSDPVAGLDPAALRAEIGVPADEHIALYVGRIDLHHKRVDEAARQVAGTPGWHLAVVGPDYRGDEARLAEIVADLPGGDRIHLLGPRQGRALGEAFVGSDVFALMSRFEGLSMALLEALSHGLPSIVSAEVESVLPVAASGAGWSTDPAAMSELLSRIADHGEWTDLREGARQMVNPYRWDTIASTYGALYASLLAPAEYG